MLAVLVYTALSFIGILIWSAKLHNNAGMPWISKTTVGNAFMTTIWMGLMYWWIISNVGMYWATWLMVAGGVVSAITLFWDAFTDGETKYTQFGLYRAATLSLVVNIGLWLALI